MNTIFRSRWLLALILTCPVATGAAHATTIDPLLFEELILTSDFVGIVECEQAGGIIAQYKIIESWKGPKAGATISIRVAVDYWEPQFPIALCGERYFITAYKQPPFRMMSTTGGGGVPLWWRQIPSDYRLPLFQGRQLMKAGKDTSPKFSEMRKSAQALLALKPAEQEAALLKAVIDHSFFGKRWIGGEPDETKEKAIRARFAKLTTAEAMVREVIHLTKTDPKKWSVRARIVLEKGGGATALAQLEKLPADQSIWDKDDLEWLQKRIQSRQKSKNAAPSAEPAKKETPPTEVELAKYRKIFAAGEETEGFDEAFEKLIRYDPSPVIKYLIAWSNPKANLRDPDRGYVLGSYFAWQCGKDRAQHLRALVSAKDPFIRVAGAVYLCFEDAEAGTAELKKVTTLNGDPGVWAALTLSRRGHKDAVPRALEVFHALSKDEEAQQFSMAGVPHRNLQKRVLVLLSNSARASSVPQPPSADEADGAALLRWWQQHRDKVQLTDPWSKILAEQKVD